jgi:hypothetical protein
MTDADARLWEERLSRLRGPGASPEAPGDATASPEAPDGDARPASLADEPDTSAPAARPWRERRRPPDPHVARRQPLALLLDWENIKISLADVLAQMPEVRAQALRPRLGGAELAARLLDAAARHGIARQRWAVADWDRPFFEGDQKAVKAARFWPDIAGGDKVNSSDHVLREKIHHVLREYPDVGVYVIGTGDGDFLEAIRTLQQQGKHVILWATRRSINQVYGESLRGPDRIQIEWLEDLVFGDAAAD